MKYIGYNDDKSESELILVRGHPGSGKTTMANLFEICGYKHFENDAFFTNEEGFYKFDFANHQKAKDVCLEKTKEALNNGYKVVVSNTFTKLYEMDPFIQYAKQKDIPVRVIEMELNYKNVHDVPEHVVVDKKNQFEKYDGAIKIDNPYFNVVKKEYVKVRQFGADVAPYDGKGTLPEYHVAESMKKLDIVIDYFSKGLVNEYDRNYIETQKKDIKSLKNIKKLIKDVEPIKVAEAISKMDTLVRGDIPNDLFILLGGSIFNEKMNSSRFNDMSSSEITDSFYNIINAYNNSPEEAKKMDADFTKKFFVNAEEILKFEDTRNRKLGY